MSTNGNGHAEVEAPVLPRTNRRSKDQEKVLARERFFLALCCGTKPFDPRENFNLALDEYERDLGAIAIRHGIF